MLFARVGSAGLHIHAVLPRANSRKMSSHENVGNSTAAISKSTVAEIHASCQKLLERTAAAERRTAEQDAISYAAEAECTTAFTARDAALAEAQQAKAACRELQQATGELEAERDDIAKRLGDKRRELSQNIDEAINATNEAHSNAKILEEKAHLAGRIEAISAQLAAAEKHWAAEAHGHNLEERLLVARLAEADGKLREALLQVRSTEACAAERTHLRSMEKQWKQLEDILGKTDAAMAQHDEQVAAFVAEAEKLEEERDTLTAKVAKLTAKRTKALEQTLPDLAARLAAVEKEQQRVKDECRDLQRTLVEARASKAPPPVKESQP